MEGHVCFIERPGKVSYFKMIVAWKKEDSLFDYSQATSNTSYAILKSCSLDRHPSSHSRIELTNSEVISFFSMSNPFAIHVLLERLKHD